MVRAVGLYRFRVTCFCWQHLACLPLLASVTFDLQLVDGRMAVHASSVDTIYLSLSCRVDRTLFQDLSASKRISTK